MKAAILFISGLLFSACAHAQDIKMIGTIDKTTTIPKSKSLSNKPTQVHIELLKIELSEAAHKVLSQRAHATLTESKIQPTASLPSKIQHSMNSVHNLNQAVLAKTDTEKTLMDVKTVLNQKDNVTFSVMLWDTDKGLVGAVGKHKCAFDTWLLTPEIAQDLSLRTGFGAHEMVITGYDDEAVAIDDQGRQHKGLLTLRNTWSEKYGVKGNFYMSYDYFKVLVIDAQRIHNVSDALPENVA